jgi:hypothetical protein
MVVTPLPLLRELYHDNEDRVNFLPASRRRVRLPIPGNLIFRMTSYHVTESHSVRRDDDEEARCDPV